MVASEGKVGASHRAQVGGEGWVAKIRLHVLLEHKVALVIKDLALKNSVGVTAMCPLSIATKEKVT